ncbi:ethanolamine kinase-like [Anopheles albimanus]|uniref:ethanolamine kinase n=1 Tax=Anopheles albimanus TaxID=7167 RepID=A0A182FM71_ANOAL|nr:ethanolamine kinase-like [Anopheles albimanus]XP_035790794.1 ethanolamine kinase-like [Anopheles albimanus]XP_035790803.1 ethanolamine kinase-like [Anopheles albimanus]
MANAVPHVPLTIGEHSVNEGALEVLKVIRPNWRASDVRFKLFTDGITNKLVGCFNQPNQRDNALSKQSSSSSGSGSSPLDATLDNDVVLVRVYGNKTDLLIDRRKEVENIVLLHQHGYAPALYATFDNGLAYAYEAGVTLTPHTCQEERIWPLVARRLAQIHKVRPTAQPGKPDAPPALPAKVHQFLQLVPERFSDATINDRVWQTFPCASELRTEFDALYARLLALGSPIVFCHNDLLLGNVIYDEARAKVTFIDYEYAALNHQAFDIGNHFTEFAGVDEIDYERYPTREFQQRWLRAYLQEYGATEGAPAPGVSANEVERLYVQVNQYALASHFLWAVWALVQAEHSTIDFDYVRFGATRFLEYRRKKEEFLRLTLPE